MGRRMADFEIGSKVREKSGRGPLMTVKRITPQSYIVCWWHGKDREAPQGGCDILHGTVSSGFWGLHIKLQGKFY